MAMDVGVVTIKYLDHPPRLVSEFLSDFSSGSLLGLEGTESDEEAWGGGWGRDSLLEFSRSHMERRAQEWADLGDADPAVRETLRNWIAALPWQNDTIMLHLGG